MRIGIDLDGVLVDFTKSYNALVKGHLGLDLPYPAQTWDYHLDNGMTQQQSNAMWEIIKATPFHGTMLPLPGALDALERLNNLSIAGNDIYFITSRTGKLAKFWTELWLKNHGMDLPTVLIARDKGPVAAGLNLHAFVDDKPENIMDVAKATQKTKLYLVDQPYNQGVELQDRLVRVGHLNDVLELEFPTRRAA